MMVGYVLDQALGLILATCVLWAASRKEQWRRLHQIAARSLKSFYDCAVLLAFSIEVASLIFLIKEDYGISTSGMGEDTVRITQAVSVLVVLPLVYGIVILRPDEPANELSTKSEKTDAAAGKSQPSDEEREWHSQRFMLLVFCWAPAYYPFYSKMIATFGPSKISNHSNAAMTPGQYETVENLCFEGVNAITATENLLMGVFVILAYIPLSLFIVAEILWVGVKRNHRGSKTYRRLQTFREEFLKPRARQLKWATLIIVPLLAAGLLWSIFRAQEVQRQLTAAIGGSDRDNSWTFGQVVAVTVFAPVLVDAWSAYVKEIA